MSSRTPRAIWSGSISFGLVNVPVRMYSAIDEQDVHFHLLHRKDDSRIGYEKVCKEEGKPVPDDEIGKAFEVAEGEYVYLTDEDFEAAEGPKHRTVDLCDFVPYDEIDPIYFERTFYLGPAGGAEKVYALLVRALTDSGLVGIAKYVLRNRQHLGCLRVRDGAIALEKMYFADEVRPVGPIGVTGVRVSKRELQMASELIDRLAGSFDISKYRDDHREALLDVIDAKRKGREVHGVPVFDTVAQAVDHHGRPVDGSVVTVPPAFTKDAVLEATENGIELIVIVTERIPRGDVAQMVELASMRGARIIGPNCLGLIVPGVCKMGGIGGPARDAAKAYAPGPVGVMSRSGGMTTEISSSLTAAGLGVSTAISIGGDAIIGSTYAELMPLFEADEQTQAIVIYTEPGGRMEAQLSEWVAENESRLPIVAFMAGRFMDDEELKGMSFGHAGTIVEGVEDTAAEKIARLEAAEIRVVERIDEIPEAVKERLGVTA